MAKHLTKLTTAFTDIEGKQILNERKEPIFVGRFLANLIANARSNDAVRAIMIAQKIYQAKEDGLELEDADYELVQRVITDAQVANVIRAQLLDTLKDRQPELKSV